MRLSGVVAHYRGWVLSIIVQHGEGREQRGDPRPLGSLF